MKGFTGDAHFFDENINIEKIQKLLDNKSGNAGISEKLEAMKTLLAMISKGEDVSNVFADVVKNVVVNSVEVKKLVYMYLVHYADANVSCRELALLSINSFQRDLADANPLIRALALRVLTSIRVADIVQIQLIALQKCATDVSPYVRKCAGNAIPKLFALEQSEEHCDVLSEIVQKLLQDTSTMVLGSALQAFHDVCPHRLDLIHPVYRKICNVMCDIDEWGQTIALTVLMRYIRTQFPCPLTSEEEAPTIEHAPVQVEKKRFYADLNTSQLVPKSSPFYLDSANSVANTMVEAVESGQLNEDHRLLLRTSLPLLKSRNSAVVLQVASLHYYCGTHSDATSNLIGKALVRIMRSHREVQYVVLSVIASMVTSRPSVFRPFVNDFFVLDKDPAYTRDLKLEILTKLGDDETIIHSILKEFQAYVTHADKKFVTTTIQSLGKLALKVPSIADQCFTGLMQLICSSPNDQVVAESVIVLRKLMQSNPHNNSVAPTLRQLATMLLGMESSDAKSSIIWILGEFQNTDAAKSIILDALRLLAKGFTEESSTLVKNQILNLAIRVSIGYKSSSKKKNDAIQAILVYILELCKYDVDYDLRDRARFVSAILKSDVPEANSKVILLAEKPSVHTIEQGLDHPTFVLGSLSNVVNHAVPGYQELPPWNENPVDNTIRDTASSYATSHGASGSPYNFSDNAPAAYERPAFQQHKSAPTKPKSGFYSSSESESDNGSSSSSEDESSGDESETAQETHSPILQQYQNDESSSSGESSDDDESDSDEVSDSEDDSDSEENESDIFSQRNKSPVIASSSANAPLDVFSHFDTLSKPSSNSVDIMNDYSTIDLSGLQLEAGPSTSQNDFKVPLENSTEKSIIHPSTLGKRMTLLSPGVGTNQSLFVECAFERNNDNESNSESAIQYYVTNQGMATISRIRIFGTLDGKKNEGVPIIPILHANSTASSRMQLQLNGRISTLRMELSCSLGTFVLSVTPPAGELVYATNIQPESFTKGSASISKMHQYKATVPTRPIDVKEVVRKAVNLASVSDESNDFHFYGKTKMGNEPVFVSITSVDATRTIQVNCAAVMLSPLLLEELRHSLL